MPIGSLPETATLTEHGIGARAALGRFQQNYDAHLSASPGAHYFGFVTGEATPAALAG